MTQKKSSNRRKLFLDSASSEQSLVAELIASNVDLLTEILLRLPAKSLIRFKCVSKHWLDLISDCRFACNHARQNSNSLISGIYWQSQWEEQVKFVSLHGQSGHPTLAFLNHDYSRLYIYNSCNGLMMCSHGPGTPFIVCNLTTQKYTEVPYPGGPSLLSVADHSNGDACLAFDPSKSPHFKVVVATPYYIDYHDGERSYKILIYSSLSASWKRLFFPCSPFFSVGDKVFCNGAIHWISKENIHFRFELDAEELIETSIPPTPKILDDNNIRYFGECCGRLLLIQIRKFSAEGFRILEMDTDYCSWTVKHRVNLRPVIALFPETVQTNRWSNSRYGRRIWKFSVLSVVEEANKKDCSLLLGISGKVISYNLKTKTWKVLHDDFPPEEFTEYFYGPSYIRGHQVIESLSPVLTIPGLLGEFAFQMKD